ncbi:MAG: hypothetical protein NC079_11965 [Clostridium sp.]|nr:hypothetical protein [Acetatifactor muris]MCM1528211.1 hypothetical protein [Bacteroides sp.]MCM1564306.1 hypothetical protein [Clostridium sp.]
MIHRIGRRGLSLFLIGLSVLAQTGCSLSGSNAQDLRDGIGGSVKINTMESTPVVDYAVPQLFPNILVDVAGYRATGGKRAAVKGAKLPRSFDLVDAQTGEVVFTGTLEEKVYHPEQDMYSAYADFKSWEQEGDYYLECQYVGRSYSFTLEDGLYDDLFYSLCRDLIDACGEQQVSVADVDRMLLAYEWYGDVFADEDRDKTPDVLEAVADWIEATGEQPVAEGQEAAYVAMLARFSYLYQRFDRQFATECLKRASVVLEQSRNMMQDDADSFHALTELYRATGLATYNAQILEYKTYFNNHKDFTERDGYLYGAMTYIGTRQSVDVELCTFFVDALMAQGEAIDGLYEEMIHPVTAHNNGESDLLHHALELACANYVVNNQTYNQIMEEFLHYLRGQNVQSVDFYETGTEDKSKYLIILTQLVAVKENPAESNDGNRDGG